VSIRDDTNNKSPGAIYHASPEGVSIRDDTNTKSPAAIWRVSPAGVSHVDVVNNQQLALCAVMKLQIKLESLHFKLPLVSFSTRLNPF
ncbi:MAG: hypothetical protein RQ982_12585, partial [Gammaproteobacteria bacterium]|nr:hypothetical protein [Gammaproteobacteria bacterium]